MFLDPNSVQNNILTNMCPIILVLILTLFKKNYFEFILFHILFEQQKKNKPTQF